MGGAHGEKTRMRSFSLVALLALVAGAPVAMAACSSTDESPSDAPGVDDRDASTQPDSQASASEDGGDTPGPRSACPRVAKPEDRARKVVISHSFDEDGEKKNAKVYEILELSATGELTRTNETFEMGRGFSEIAFTPDGEVGLVPQEDGSLGVFTFDSDGKVRVIHAAFREGFYARHVVVSRDGARAFVLDPNTANNGGGVYEIAIGCDGTLSHVSLAVPGGQAHAMALVPTNPDHAVLIAGAAFDSTATDYAHLLDLAPATPARLTSGAVFADRDAIASSVAVTPDGKWALVTDNSVIQGNRMAAVALDTMKATATIEVPSPAAVVMSPFGNAALLLESDGNDALVAVTYDPANAAKPFAVKGKIAYKSGKTELPSFASVIDRGALKGHVLVAELLMVRHLAFKPDGSIADLGAVTFEGFSGIVGSLGVQP